MIRKTITRRTALSLAAGTAAALSLPGLALAQTIEGLMTDIPLEDRVMGNADAPVTLVEYASMTCPHCKSFHEDVLPTIKEKYIDTGKVKYILRPFPFQGDARGEAAFMLALCAPQSAYYPIVDSIYRIQNELRTSPTIIEDLKRIAKLAGMSEEQFNDCLSGKSQDLYVKMIEGRNKATRDFQVTGTPSLYVNDQKLGDYALETVTAAIEAAL